MWPMPASITDLFQRLAGVERKLAEPALAAGAKAPQTRQSIRSLAVAAERMGAIQPEMRHILEGLAVVRDNVAGHRGRLSNNLVEPLQGLLELVTQRLAATLPRVSDERGATAT